MPFTWNPQFGSVASLITNSSKPATTVPLMRTIFPSNDAGFFTTSHTVVSTTCARQARTPNPRNQTSHNKTTLHKTLSSRCELGNGSKIEAATSRHKWELERISRPERAYSVAAIGALVSRLLCRRLFCAAIHASIALLQHIQRQRARVQHLGRERRACRTCRPAPSSPGRAAPESSTARSCRPAPGSATQCSGPPRPECWSRPRSSARGSNPPSAGGSSASEWTPVSTTRRMARQMSRLQPPVVGVGILVEARHPCPAARRRAPSPRRTPCTRRTCGTRAVRSAPAQSKSAGDARECLRDTRSPPRRTGCGPSRCRCRCTSAPGGCRRACPPRSRPAREVFAM